MLKSVVPLILLGIPLLGRCQADTNLPAGIANTLIPRGHSHDVSSSHRRREQRKKLQGTGGSDEYSRAHRGSREAQAGIRSATQPDATNPGTQVPQVYDAVTGTSGRNDSAGVDGTEVSPQDLSSTVDPVAPESSNNSSLNNVGGLESRGATGSSAQLLRGNSPNSFTDSLRNSTYSTSDVPTTNSTLGYSSQNASISQLSNSTDASDLGTAQSPAVDVGNTTYSALNASSPSSNDNLTNGATESNASSAASSSGVSLDLPQSYLQQGDLYLGFLPDDGSSGGTRQTMAQLNSAIGKKAAVYGWYGQAHAGTTFDGSQLLAVIDDVKACNCVFQPAVMPIGGWQGLTPQDNSQAVAIANVMKKFTDEGIPVWMRFAHEVNYYQTDGTYQGTAQDFKTGWATVSQSMKQIAPQVKMWWTPNVDTAENYVAYEPNDMSTVDLVGVDYYPKKLTGNDFLPVMKDFHDKYAVDGRKFAIAETGLGWAGQTTDKYSWLQQICNAKSSLPQFVSAAWFNFQKEYDYQIAGSSTLNQKFSSFIATPLS